jgi:sugar transferase (PEP-CTERM/EpsH1 system associated)
VSRGRNLARAGLLYASRTPLTHVLLDAPGTRQLLERVVREWRPDVVMAFCSGMARLALEPPLDRLPFVLDMVDVDSFKWEALGEQSRFPRRQVYRREARTLRSFERRAAEEAAATLVVSESEGERMQRVAPASRTVVVKNGVDVEGFRNDGPPASDPSVVFTGVFSYPPNESGAFWFLDRVWPAVQRRIPAARLALVGADPSSALRASAGSHPGVQVTGSVPDVRPYLWDAAIAVAPLHLARGVQNKVLEAGAAGLPAVVTPAVADGLPGAVRSACRVAADEERFAGSVIELLSMSADARRRAAADGHIACLTWERCLQPLSDVLDRASAVQP